MVDDRIDGHGGLASLTVTDDQFTLSTTHRHHRIDRLQTGLHRLRHALARDHTRGNLFQHIGQLGVDRTLAIDRLAERVHDTSQQLRTHGNGQNSASRLDCVAFPDVLVASKDHCADRIALQVQSKTKGLAWEFDHFTLHHVRQTVDATDPVGHRDDRTLIPGVGIDGEVLDLRFQQFADFGWIELHRKTPSASGRQPAGTACRAPRGQSLHHQCGSTRRRSDRHRRRLTP